MRFFFNRLTLFKILILSVILFSCEGDLTYVNCENCYKDKPDWGPLVIKATLNDNNPFVPIVIYRNNIEDMDIEWVDTIRKTPDTINVPVNKYYSILAKYKVDNDTIYAIDGDKLKIKKITSECDETCWIFSGGEYDLRLKYNETP